MQQDGNLAAPLSSLPTANGYDALTFRGVRARGLKDLFVVGSFLWNNPRPSFGVPSIFQFVLGLGVLSAVLTVGALVYAVLAWKGNYWSVAFRAYYSLVTVAAVAFVWFLNYWNLLGWRF